MNESGSEFACALGVRGKVAFVTGAASGIGLAAARLLATAGANLVLVDRDGPALGDLEGELSNGSGRTATAVIDVTSPEQMSGAMIMTQEVFGRLDILCNNAGIASYGSILDTEPDAWDHVMAVNVKSVFLGCKYGAPLMIESGGGAIVNTASDVGLRGVARRTAYCASKAAVINLTRQAAIDLAGYGIRVNAVAPAATDTAFLSQVERDDDAITRAKENLAQGIPLKRLATAVEIAQTILWLASDFASFTTGETVLVDGGSLAGK